MKRPSAAILNFLVGILVLPAAGLAGGCQRNPLDAGYDAYVVEVNLISSPSGGKTLGSVGVGSRFGKGVMPDCRLAVPDGTPILAGGFPMTHPVRYTALKVGQKLHVWTTGAVLDSFPAQATATKLEILSK